MLHRHARQFRVLLAALCVALSTVLAGQFTVAAIETVEHGFDVPHAASAVAGAVVYDHHDESHHHPDAQIAAADDSAADPVSHHHHGDGPQPALLVTGEADTAFPTRGQTTPIAPNAAPPSSTPSGLERPPRPQLERFA